MSSQLYPNVFSPLEIRGKVFKNRILVAPKGIPPVGMDADRMSPEALAYFERLARGGAARVVGPECDVEYGSAVFSVYNMFLDPLPESLRESIAEYVEICHRYGALAFMHFGHMGAYCRDEEYNDRMRREGRLPPERPPAMPAPLRPDGTPYAPARPLGPTAMVISEPWDGVTQSPAQDLNDGKPVGEMTRADMERIADAFALCAANAKACGLDGISLHSGHGFLFSQWVSKRFNRRTDEFGGSMENRARFPILCLRRIRDRVGDDLLVEMRFSAEEDISPISDRPYLADLVTADEAAEFFAEIDRHPGLLDIAHITGGLHFVPYYNTRTIPNSYFPTGVNLAAAAKVKRAVRNIRVACVGGMSDPALCEEAIASGKVDFVVMARQLCTADPDFPRKAERDDPDAIDNCLRCTICCPDHVCAVNPRDTFFPEPGGGVRKADEPKRVVVVGGGIAGMKAAEYARLAGHEVTLFERAGALGGVLRYADHDRFKEDVRRYYHAVERRIRRQGVDIRLGAEADPETVRALRPDAIVVAAGAAEKPLAIPGADGENVLGCVEAYLAPERVGGRVVILGGGLSGAEAAIHWADQGRRVCVVTRAARLMNRVKTAGPADGSTDAQLIWIDRLGVETRTECVPTRIAPDGVYVSDAAGREAFLPADTILRAVGMRSRPEAAEPYRALAPLVITIGDAAAPGNIGGAVRSAYEAIRAL